jgi:Ca2+-binding RTX toxin-like protein
MTAFWFHRFVGKKPRRRCEKPRSRSFLPRLEQLDDRILPAVTASFSAATGILTVNGDAQNNTIVVSRDAAGTILVNGGAVAVQGGAATVANTTLIQVFGQAGDDRIALDETNGALPAAKLDGGDGNDTLIGGSGNDQLFGGAGDDSLFGGAGDDTLVGGAGNDRVFGEAGNDRLIWNPGDGSDLNEGGDGVDTVEVNGGNASERFLVSANGSRVRFDRTDPNPFSLDIGTSENLVVNGNGGDDTISAAGLPADLIALTFDGGAGNDTLIGGDGNDLLIGGDGNDTITGGKGSDTALMGAGDDTFVWNPGDGSDKVEGQTGNDTLQFNGSNADEKIDLSANGTRLRLSRDVGHVTMDVNGVEQVNVTTLGGADNVTVHNLAGTGVSNVNIDLSSPAGSGAGDGQADTVTLEGTNRADNVQIAGSGGSFAVRGLSAEVSVQGSEAANDSLVVKTLGGNDVVNASGLAADTVKLTVDGGRGNDTITGSDGNDLLIGGDGNDTITGGKGSDTALMGAGNDTFVWNPGDGSDTVEGQAGKDTLQFNGSNADEKIDLSANGTRLRLSRDVGRVTMDVNGVEQVNVAALGGADDVTVNDLSGTGVRRVNIDLSSPAGSGAGDGQADTVTVNGTPRRDGVLVGGRAGDVVVAGLAAQIHIAGAEPAQDQLVVNTGDGNDLVIASPLPAGAIRLVADGGNGNDVLIGSRGCDTLIGGPGNDVLIGGPGNDTLDAAPGHDVVVQ